MHDKYDIVDLYHVAHIEVFSKDDGSHLVTQPFYFISHSLRGEPKPIEEILGILPFGVGWYYIPRIGEFIITTLWSSAPPANTLVEQAIYLTEYDVYSDTPRSWDLHHHEIQPELLINNFELNVVSFNPRHWYGIPVKRWWFEHTRIAR